MAFFNLTSPQGVQEALTELGFDPGPADGIAGPKTQKAVREYQTSKGLTADGIVGRMTRAALAEDLRARGHDVKE
ncbi:MULTISPECIES: peptidoglycan-binding domain-containing protein [unclassified Streptomyces]|uniref:peptidoglycan-binding domain-containing protein n=1 Tax=unclassified Streptomyces TaxID=2593676 RepID=UPI00093E4A4A|nr:peptidoglycan-binding domain-containing protein [Streptomyces sp. TSRI0107]